jgi:hypothetical protein
MIIGAHSIIYSKKPEADRSLRRDVLGLPHVAAEEHARAPGRAAPRLDAYLRARR